MFRTAKYSALLVLAMSTAASAQDWAAKMFQTPRHNFGVVARGARTEFEFVLENLYLEDVHLAAVRSSCGCTTPTIKTPLLKSREKGAVVARFNTHLFTGSKGATLTVTIDRPFFAEVQLQVSGYIRNDVVITPGSAELGTVEEGKAAEQVVAVQNLAYDTWQIVDVRSANPHLSAKAVEVARGGGQVSYQIHVSLDGKAPAGYLSDHLVLVTNDQQSVEVPLAVQALVRPSLSISPNPVFLGTVKAGTEVTRQLVVRGNSPFQILSVRAQGERMALDASLQPAARPVHAIPVRFRVGSQSGEVNDTIEIETSTGRSLVVPASALIESR